MAKISLIVFTQFIFITSSFAQSTSIQQKKWEGYKLASEVDFPNAKLRDFANNNVFQLVSAGITDSVQQVQIVDINTKSWIPKNDIATLQIETCKRQNLQKCPIINQRITGTTFFNKDRFYTCRHAVHNWLYYASTENNKPIQDIFPPVILKRPTRNSKNLQTVYSSANDQQELMRITFAQTQPVANFLYIAQSMPEMKNAAGFFDFIQMEIQNLNFVSDLDLSEIQSYPGTMSTYNEVYIVGYPGKRQFNIRAVGDSPGNTLVVSNGYIQHSLGYGDYKFITSAIATAGMSGSPVLSSEGTIIGMACGGDDIDLSNNGSNPRDFRSYPSPLNIEFFINIWAQYGYPTDLIPQNVQRASFSN